MFCSVDDIFLAYGSVLFMASWKCVTDNMSRNVFVIYICQTVHHGELIFLQHDKINTVQNDEIKITFSQSRTKNIHFSYINTFPTNQKSLIKQIYENGYKSVITYYLFVFIFCNMHFVLLYCTLHTTMLK